MLYVLLFLFKGIEICGRSSDKEDSNSDGQIDNPAFDIILANAVYDNSGGVVVAVDNDTRWTIEKQNIATKVEFSNDESALKIVSDLDNRLDFLNVSSLEISMPF